MMANNLILVSGPAVRNSVAVMTLFGQCQFYTFKGLVDNKEHLALVFKEANRQCCPVVRIHSECITGDLFGSEKCDCGDQLQEAMTWFGRDGGILLYLRQEGRGIGLYNKLDAYALQALGYDTNQANQLLNFPIDMRDYQVAAEMLRALQITQIKLLSNNPDKVAQLEKYAISIKQRIATGVFIKEHNKHYLKTKQKSGHQLEITL